MYMQKRPQARADGISLPILLGDSIIADRKIFDLRTRVQNISADSFRCARWIFVLDTKLNMRQKPHHVCRGS